MIRALDILERVKIAGESVRDRKQGSQWHS